VLVFGFVPLMDRSRRHGPTTVNGQFDITAYDRAQIGGQPRARKVLKRSTWTA
jgi:hypothetical protein